MSSIRKAGVAFYPGVGVSPDLTGLAGSLSLKYKRRGEASFTGSGASFTEENAGTYAVALTLNTVGDYIVIIESTDPRIENLEGNVLVTAASIDDVNNAVGVLQTDLTAIKTQVDLLDENSLNGIETQITTLAGHVATIEALLDGDDNASLNVLKGLIDDLANSGIGSISTFVDNLELMLEGKEYVDTDGNTVLEVDSHGLSDLYAQLAALDVDVAEVKAGVDTAVIDIASAKADLLADITALETLVVGKVDAVKAVVDANKNHLEDSGYGLDALKTILGTIIVDISDIYDGTVDIHTVLTEGANSLEVIKTTIMTKLDAMDIKLDSISGSTGSRMFL